MTTRPPATSGRRAVNRPRAFLPAAFLALTAFPVASANPSSSPPWCIRYSVETIAGPDCVDGTTAATYARAIHDGVIVGEYWQCGTSLGEGFIWRLDGAFEVIPRPAGVGEMFPADLNTTTVVGRMVPIFPGTSGTAFAFADGVVTTLGPPPGSTSPYANAINDSGVVVGTSYVAGKIRPAQWLDGVATTIALPGWVAGVANDVNAKGQRCGYMTMGSFFGAHAFLLDGEQLIDAGTLAGSTTSAGAINGNAEMVGYGLVPRPDGEGTDTRGFLWADGVMTIIEPPPGFANGFGNDINDEGWIVGVATGGSIDSRVRGFVWKDGIGVLLDDLIPPDAGIVVTSAVGIDANGVIAARAQDAAGNVVAVRLTPMKRLVADLDCDGVVGGGDLGLLLAA